MISFNLSELTVYSNISLFGKDIEINKVSTDSRDCRGALFIALIGEHFDGHSFIDKAIENGAVAVAVSNGQVYETVSTIKCPNTLDLLGYCGLLVRLKSNALVLSLTGSCGKTTVKEFTYNILERCGKSMATQGNFNNDVGVPLTLLRIERDTKFAVIEQGASHPQDIARTCRFVKSKIALINNVGGAHIEGFGSSYGIYKGKSEILDDVFLNDGIGIVPCDSPWYKNWCDDYAQQLKEKKLLSFGTKDIATVQLLDLKSSLDKLDFKLRLPKGEIIPITLNVLGEHNALNAAAAALLAYCAGASSSDIRLGLSQSKNLQGRLCAKNFENFTLIDDAYNASFGAVIAACKTLSMCKGHKVMIFGDMGELGAESEDLHTKVGMCAKEYVDELLCVGEMSKHTVKAFGERAKHFNCHLDLVKYALGLLNKQYCSFLVKGAHSMHMQTITDELVLHGEKVA